MATLNEIVAGLKTQVEGFATSLDAKLAQLNTVKDAASAATATVLAAFDRIFNLRGFRGVYINSLTGNDANTGLSLAQAVRTWGRAMELLQSTRRSVVYVLSDIVADQSAILYCPPGTLEMIGFNEAGTAVQRRKITFTDATNAAGLAGGIYSYSSIVVATREIDFEMAHSVAQHPFYIANGHLTLQAVAGTITRVGTSAQALIFPVCSAHVRVSGIVIDPSASGYVLKGVPSGGDPNAVNGYSANFVTN